ncbi:polyamine aminopropyltransferase [Micromonospora sp. NPDC049559]|uniref:polyamine aminopropyltransferase n=1 Tax=Micromonospora sp. NPDC049559 TaxID=3155923 RepID=UPI00341E8BF4
MVRQDVPPATGRPPAPPAAPTAGGPASRPPAASATSPASAPATGLEERPSGGTRWFTERELPHGRPGIAIQVEIDAVLHDERSRWGHIQVFDTPFHGRMLVLDGVIQTTERDEFVYHEMLVLTPSIQHGAPETMLVVGGGDGGALRQALRLRSLRRVVQVEIDDAVTRVCREHLPTVSGGAFDDPRVELVFADGADYLAAGPGGFDVLVLDLTDPVPGGPAERLFETELLADARRALAPGGVLAMQCGSLTMQPDEVRTQLRRLGEVFGSIRLHTAVVPGYQLTTFGFLLAAEHPLDEPAPAELAARWANVSGDCDYLSPEMYRASAALPPYLRRLLAS